MAGRYEGDFLVTLLEDGRNLRLESDLFYFDPQGVRWGVPKGAVVDGASIPRGFWSAVGGPLEGKYRNASIIHDWFCDKRTRTWQATHRVFYDAMRTSGVGEARAKLFYFAVWWGGPRWEERVSLNTNLPAGSDFSFKRVTPPPPVSEIVAIESPGARATSTDQKAAASRMRAMLKAQDLSLEAIEALADAPQR